MPERVRVRVPEREQEPVQLGVRVQVQEQELPWEPEPQRHHSQERPWRGSRHLSASTDPQRFSKLRPRHCASC